MLRVPLILISIALSHTMIVTDIEGACYPIKEQVACYRTATDEIFISDKLGQWKKLMALYHEMGHRLMKFLDTQTYKEIFGDGEITVLKERAAEDFNLWAIGRKIPKKETEFFNKLVL